MRIKTRESKRTVGRRSLRQMSKRFGTHMAVGDRRHHHRLVPLHTESGSHVGYCCRDTNCEELFTQTGGVSRGSVERPVNQLGSMRVNSSHRVRARLRAELIGAM